jgi:hypothetical protein
MRGCLVVFGALGTLICLIIWLVYDQGGFEDTKDPPQQEAAITGLQALFILALVCMAGWLIAKNRR